MIRSHSSTRAATTALVAMTAALAMGQGAGQSPVAASSWAFRENKGQWDARARFLSQTAGLDYWVTADGVTLDAYRYAKRTSDPGLKDADGEPLDTSGPYREGHVVRMRFVGSNQTPQVRMVGRLRDLRDYFVAGREARGVASYGEVTMRNVYRNVDVRHYFDKGRLRFDVVVRPGGDPRDLKFRFDGAESIRVGADGHLYVGTSIGDVKVADLFTYQEFGAERRRVESSFELDLAGNVTVRLGRYDTSRPLVIDPLVYGSYVGSDSSADEFVNNIYADAFGNVYMTGSTSSPAFPVNQGPYGRFAPQGRDAFLVRMDGDAYSVSYSAVLGGGATDIGVGIGFHPATSSLWVAGTSGSADFSGITGGGKGSGTRVWVAKFNVVGNVITPAFVRWRNELGSIGANTVFNGLRVSPSGNVVLVGGAPINVLQTGGFTNFLGFPIGTTQRAAYVAMLDAAGDYRVRRMVAGAVNVDLGGASRGTYGSEIALRFNSFAVNAQGDVVLVGGFGFLGTQDTSLTATPVFGTTAGVFPGEPGLFNGGRIAQNDTAFVVKINQDGTTGFSLFLGGAGADLARTAAFDLAGNVYVSGLTESFNFQRTRGAFDEAFSSAAKVFLTKLSPDGSRLVYSTGLRTVGVVEPTSLAVDTAGNAAVAGFVGFIPLPPLPEDPPQYLDSIPGSIFTTPDALDGAFEGGNSQVDEANVPDPNQRSVWPSTTDGFMTYVNPSGTNVVYSSYIGEFSDDKVRDAFSDSVGAVWFAGSSQGVVNANLATRAPAGIAPHITSNAFKAFPSLGGLFPGYVSSNGWIVKLRVRLPILQNVLLSPPQVAGGLGAVSIATVLLREPAPVGGVPIALTLGNAQATSFSPTPGQLTTTVVVPEGANSASAPIYTFPVAMLETSSVRAVLDNDFRETTLTIAPWLTQLMVSPTAVVGGAPVQGRATLFQNAPTGGVRVPISTDRPDIVRLPSPPEIFVPAGTNLGNASIETSGVDAETPTLLTGVFLGVQRSQSLVVRPASLITLTFNPSSVNGGENSVGTVQLNGLTGSSRTVTLSYVAGVTGVLVNGQPLPAQVTVPSQSNSVSFAVTTPPVGSPSSVTLRATDGTSSVQGVLGINNLDIASIAVTPGNDVISGTRLTGTVSLTRPAGPGGFVVNLASTNPAAGTLNLQQVTVPEGSVSSEPFTFQCATVGTDTTTTLSASRTGFTTRTVDVTVRAISVSMTITPNVVVGGQQNATATVTLSQAAPNTGIVFNVTSSDPTSVTVPAQVSFTSGQTVRTFPVTTSAVPSTRSVTVVANAGSNVNASAVITVNPTSVVGLAFSPNSIAIGQQTTGRLTFAAPTAPGTIVTLSANPSGVLSLPAQLNVPGGVTSFTFLAAANPVPDETAVTVTAQLGTSTTSATVTVRRPSVFSITFDPRRVRGGQESVGTITLEQNAPPGGTTVTVSSANPRIARIAGGSSVTIPAGQRTGTFRVATSRVARTFAVNFTARVGSGSANGTLTVDK